MSTRAQVIIKDETDELWFYRHSDGYPDGTLPTLNKFLDWVKQGKIRDNVEQSAGWLILIGAEEDDNKNFTPGYGKYPDLLGWKVGSYEPCLPEEHGDIRYLYTVNLTDKTITYVDR